jgi:hypothetical protein
MFLGRDTGEFETVIFTTEDGVDDYKRKLHAWKCAYPSAWRDANGRIHIVPLKGVPLALVDSSFGHADVPSGVVEALAGRTRELVPAGEVLILVETVSRVSGGDETNAGAGTLVVALERLSMLTAGGTPVPVAHVGKENARQRQTDMYAARGGSALADNARSVLVLSRPPERVLEKHGLKQGNEPDDLLVLAHAKHNRTPPEPDLLLRRKSGSHAAYFELWGGASKQVPAEENLADARARMGLRLRDVVRRVSGNGGRRAVTVNMLRDDYREELGIPKQRVRIAVDQAIDDGWLDEGGGPCPRPRAHVSNSPTGTRP